MQIVLEKQTSGLRVVVQTVPIEVTFARQTWTLRHDTVEPLWLTIKNRVVAGQSNPVTNHVLYYEFVMWSSQGAAPPPGVACATDTSTCAEIRNGGGRSTSCDAQTPCIDRSSGTPDCTCECGAGAGTGSGANGSASVAKQNYTMASGSEQACSPLRCSSRFSQCPYGGAVRAIYDKSVVYCPACGGDEDCTCDCCRNGACTPPAQTQFRADSPFKCTVEECASRFYGCPSPSELNNAGSSASSVPTYVEHAACEPPSPPPAPTPCGADDCSCECCFADDCPTLTTRTWRAGTEERCSVDQCMSRFSVCPDRGAHNAGSSVVPTWLGPTEDCPYPPSPLSPPVPPVVPSPLAPPAPVVVVTVDVPAPQESSTTIFIVGVAGGACLFCAIGACLFILWIRHRELKGSPVWVQLREPVQHVGAPPGEGGCALAALPTSSPVPTDRSTSHTRSGIMSGSETERSDRADAARESNSARERLADLRLARAKREASKASVVPPLPAVSSASHVDPVVV